jgi:LysM repeat protein
MKRTGWIGLGSLALLACMLPVLAGAANPPDPAPGSPLVAPEGPYVVKKGDTLWGISRDLLQDPLLWPRLWETNSFITNPHRIYPGDQLAVPGKDLAPAPPVAEAPKPAPPAQTVEAPKPPPPAAPAPAPPVAPMPPPAPVAAIPPPAPVAATPAPEPPVPPASRHAMVCSPGLVPEQKVDSVGIGTLVKSAEERLMLSMEDRVVVGLDDNHAVKKGDQFLVARTGRRLINPRTGQSAGRVLYAVGLLEVTEVQARVVQARVSYSCGPIGLGDRVIPYAPLLFPDDKTPQPARRSVSGVIVDSLRGEQLMGIQQIAFVDVGADQGVALGDVFALRRPNLPAPMQTGVFLPMPSDQLGDAVVIRVVERSVTVLLTSSAREVRVGDQAILSHQIAP